MKKKVIKSSQKECFKNKVKNVLLNMWNYIKNRKILFLCIPFVLMDIFTFLFGLGINYTNKRLWVTILFNINYITLFVGLCLNVKKIYSKILYIILNIVFILLYLVNNVYFSMTNNFFGFNLLESTSEGMPYIWDAICNCNPFVYVTFIIIVISIILSLKRYPNIRKTNFKNIIIIVLSFTLVNMVLPFCLGSLKDELEWSNWRNARSIYENFNDNNKSLLTCGFFEYFVRNFYITYLKPDDVINEEQLSFLDSSFEENISKKNKYTGKFTDKNLIIIQLEGMDNWLVNKNDTPHIYKLMNEGIDFTKHYSYYNGGGSTFNSEFAINTGFITPLSYNRNAYTFSGNSFPNTLASIFKKNDYVVNAFHMNTGEYYSRSLNYKNWGYDNYYGLMDIDEYKDKFYQLDRELILNEKFNELLFPENTKFLDYIITYSGHLPFSNKKGVCKMLYDEDSSSKDIELDTYLSTEEECVRRQAKETDYMIELLLNELKTRNLLDKTVITLVTDHYLYTLDDISILDRYKNTSNNLINNTPFIIWSSNISKSKVNKVTSQLNVLPTLLNLFGVKYNVNNYIGQDALASNYEGIVFFSDYSWYDGNVYVDNGIVTNNKKISKDSLERKNELISYLTQKNDLTLKFDYFGRKS